MHQKIQQVFQKLNGNKLLIGLLLDWLVEWILPEKTWYTDLTAIIAYGLIFVGGTHKIAKIRIGYLEKKYGGK